MTHTPGPWRFRQIHPDYGQIEGPNGEIVVSFGNDYSEGPSEEDAALLVAAPELRDLLKRYMEHVGDSEGSTFLGMPLDNSDKFTEEEKTLLRAIEDEIFGAEVPKEEVAP